MPRQRMGRGGGRSRCLRQGSGTGSRWGPGSGVDVPRLRSMEPAEQTFQPFLGANPPGRRSLGGLPL